MQEPIATDFVDSGVVDLEAADLESVTDHSYVGLDVFYILISSTQESWFYLEDF